MARGRTCFGHSTILIWHPDTMWIPNACPFKAGFRSASRNLDRHCVAQSCGARHCAVHLSKRALSLKIPLQPTCWPTNTWASNRIKQSSCLGLFGEDDLRSPDWMVQSSKKLIKKAMGHVNSILSRHHTVRMSDLKPDALLLHVRETIDAFDELSNVICKLTDTSEFLRNVHPNPSWVLAADTVYAELSSLLHRLNTDQNLYHSLKATVASAKEQPSLHLTPLELQNASVFLRDFEHSGIYLTQGERDQHVATSNEINESARKFFSFDFPPVLAEQRPAGSRAEKSNIQSLKFDHSMCLHILSVSSNEELRKMAFYALNADHPKQEINLNTLLSARRHQAKLAGFASFAHLFLHDKMLDHPNRVLSVLDRLSKECLPAVKSTISTLEQVKGAPLQEWDKAYFSRTQCVSTPQQLGTCPTLATSMNVFSDLMHSMFGIDCVASSEAAREGLWHPHVVKLSITYQGLELGTIYCDFLDRQPSKVAQAAHFAVRGRRVALQDLPESTRLSVSGQQLRQQLHVCQNVQKPIVVLSLCLNDPNSLSWSQVETLWHELGHALHSVLSFTHYQNISGTRCPLDVSEVPSIFMELLLAHPQVKDQFERRQPGVHAYLKQHSATLCGSVADEQASANQVFELESQIILAAMDQLLHYVRIDASRQTAADFANLMRTEPDKIPELSPYPHLRSLLTCLPWDNRWRPHLRLQHLATYSSGYYTYLWSRAIATEIFTEHFNPATAHLDWAKGGEKLWDEFLGWGGGRSPWECIYRILGSKGAHNLEQLACA